VETVKHQGERSLPIDSEDSRHAAQAREDALLLAAIAMGDQRSLATLYERRGGLIYSLLVQMLTHEMEAQEVMQDTFVRIWRSACEYDPAQSSPLAWMIMIARGRAKDRLRARSRRSARDVAYQLEMAPLELDDATGAKHAERGELAAACSDAMKRLPEAQGHALQLAFFRGWTHEEIAGALGEPLGTVKARIRRGLLALRQALKDHHG
jgi:RNA polymerase sigma-70 factor (ECF subfamily)